MQTKSCPFPFPPTAAAELIDLCSCAQEVAWARKFLSELGFPQQMRWQFICEFLERDIIRIEKIPGRLQLADLGIGARPHPDFLRLSSSIYDEDSSPDVQP